LIVGASDRALTDTAAHASGERSGGSAGGSADEIKRIDELGEIFAALDELKGTGGVNLNDSFEWQLPMFIVLGSESAGKSTLLERVSMYSIFPRAENICTRMAIKIKLRRTEKAETPELSVVDLKTEKEIEPPRPIPVATGHTDVREAMNDAIRREHKNLCGISLERMLVLHVRSPSVPTLSIALLPVGPSSLAVTMRQASHTGVAIDAAFLSITFRIWQVPTLDFVDLPGLCSMSHRGEPADMAAQTRKLITQVIEEHRQHAVFLLVMPASIDPRVAPVMEIVTEHRLEAQSIGVFTKCDDIHISYAHLYSHLYFTPPFTCQVRRPV